MATRISPTPKKASGRNVEEWERKTVRARVPRGPVAKLASRWGCTETEAIVRAVTEAAEQR